MDKYSWLRDKNWPQVDDQRIIEYLTAENKAFDNAMHTTSEMQETIYQELKERIQEEDQSYPIKKSHYSYYTCVAKNKDYPILFRTSNEQQELLLDVNLLSIGKSSFSLGDVEVSDDHKKLAYSYDAEGAERYNIKVRDLQTNKDLDDIIEDTIGDVVWNKDASGFYYVALNTNWRSDKVYFHEIGTKQQDDILIYLEKDQCFSVGISRSSSEEYLLVESGNAGSNETWYLSLDNNILKLAIKRTEDLLYHLDHMGNNFYLQTNDMGVNFRLVSVKVQDNFASSKFQEIIAHDDNKYLTDVALYQKYIVASRSILGLNKIEYYSLDNHKFINSIDFDEEVYEANISYTNKDDPYLRISYSSLTKPKSVLEYDFISKDLFTRKVDIIPSGYDSNQYISQRLWAKSIDGTEIPISMVYRKDAVKEGSNKLLLYGYGSYGYGVPMSFRPNIFSLLDRGFIYVIAHIRGGDELGYEWYEDAKFLTKKRSFEDFIAVSEYLIDHDYTSKDQLSIMGGSAGGMLMGVVVNQRPDLFKSVVALVPFVDVLNTMLDDTLPLTPGEFEEWGNPIVSKEYYDYIKSYCPYNNVKSQDYPHMLITAGLNDPRVGYWEAAKWVEKLKEFRQNNNLLLLKTEMDTGHSGQSGRFNSLKEVAMIYSFIIMSLS